MKNNEDHFNVLRKIVQKPDSSQRELASELGFSLGKLNYCLKELKKKGFIKIENFKKSKKKLNYLYMLTPSGFTIFVNSRYFSLIPFGKQIDGTFNHSS